MEDNPNFSTSVQTGWTYSSASPHAPPESPAPAASNTQITSYTVCVAGDAFDVVRQRRLRGNKDG